MKDKPWNIKKEFGVGYSLLIEKKGGLALNQEKEIDSLIRSEIEGLTKSQDSNYTRLIYFIPFELVKKLPGLLDLLKANFEDVLVAVEVTDLEAAYLKIVENESKTNFAPESPKSVSDETAEDNGEEKLLQTKTW